MKTSVKITALLATAVAAQSIPPCAIECFQSVITEHPPLECKEADMFHCFCKDPFGPDLQRYFMTCTFSNCASQAVALEAIKFGQDVCADMGFPITVPVVIPGTSSTAQSSSAAATSSAVATTTAQSSSAGAASTSSPAPRSSSSGAATGATSSTPAGQSTTAAPASSTTAAATGSVSRNVTITTVTSITHRTTTVCDTTETQTRTTKRPATTTVVCDGSVCKPTTIPVVTVTSVVVCPGGCQGTPTGVSTVTVVTKIPSTHTEPSKQTDAHNPPTQGSVVPTKSGSGAVTTSTPPAKPSTVVVNMGNSASVNGLLAAAGVAVAVFRLL